MWGDPNWKLEDLVNLTHYNINQRNPLKSHVRANVRTNQISYMNKTISYYGNE